MKLPAGKVPPKILEEIVFDHLGTKRKEVVVGPSYGLDGAVIEIGSRLLITSMDPITGALERIGWLAVNINANDVATFGVKPAFFSSCLLLPENVTEKTVETICRQIDFGAKKLGIAVTGGHSETTPNLPFPIVVGCCMGIAEKGHYVTARGAKAGNMLILTKSVGMEGTAILATDRHTQLARKIGKSMLKRAEGFFNHISVVKEAILAFETGCITAMHDPTEGGVAGGIHELADASNVGFKVYEEKLSITGETLKICQFFQIDPLQLIASGSLLIAVEKGSADKVVEVLEKNKIAAAVIGEFLPSPKKQLIVRRNGHVEELVRPVSDHLWLALEKKPIS
ncbi:MAG: AIR synthase family protein [Candidatus Bathyarchaeota archaeon]|nr:AIR synthase family protein [Candidatus Bathyarchaeota archaeon]MDH5494315.1 AIR synthase family protein [Candidatus Bathyarchaeota archaeon]